MIHIKINNPKLKEFLIKKEKRLEKIREYQAERDIKIVLREKETEILNDYCYF